MNTSQLRFRSNRVADIASLFHADLDAEYGSGEVGMMLQMLFEAYLGWNRTKYLSSRADTINQSDLLRFHWALDGLRHGQPIQHIIGYTDFCGHRIKVSPSVLIPRPETAEMVGLAAARCHAPRRIIDLCSGSGCIAIALAGLFPEAEVWAAEWSEEACLVCQENIAANEVNIKLIRADVLGKVGIEGEFDLIASNPPYVRESERKAMDRHVADHEPAMALFVPDSDPLRFYHAIAHFAATHLARQGTLVVEINEALAHETAEAISSYGLSTSIANDFLSKPRFIIAQHFII